MRREGGVYVIRCLATGEVYVGRTVRFGERFAYHRTTLRCGTHHNRMLQAAWAEHGEAAFEFAVLEAVDDEAALAAAEAAWIDRLSARSAGLGFNVAPGREGRSMRRVGAAALGANLRSGVPIYVQLVEQFRRALEGGTLRPGDVLPTVRRLASELTIAPSTIVKAYGQLEALGLIESRAGAGTWERGRAWRRRRSAGGCSR